MGVDFGMIDFLLVESWCWCWSNADWMLIRSYMCWLGVDGVLRRCLGVDWVLNKLR